MALLILCVMPAVAKDKSQNICEKMLFFDGVVVKDESTKQKVPNGYGKLYVKGYEDVDNIAITGCFHGDSVADASFNIDDDGNGYCEWNYKRSTSITKGLIFQGSLSYTYTYDKYSKELQLTLNLLDGELWLGPESSMYFPVTLKDNLKYTMTFEKRDYLPYNRHFNIYPSTLRFKTKNNFGLNEYVIAPLKPLITENEWEANVNGGYWKVKWIGGVLKNGTNIKGEDYRKFSLSGTNGVYIKKEAESGKLPLADGGYFSWRGRGRSMRLYFPNGEIFEGSFDKVPFEKDNISGHNIEYLASAAKQIMESSSTDFSLGTGTYYYPSGKSEQVRYGKYIDRLLNNCSIGLDYYSLISGARSLSANYNGFVDLCRHDFWGYIGMGDVSKLAKTRYQKSSEYNTQYQAYTKALNSLFYAVSDCYASNFTINGASIYKDIGYTDAENTLPLLYISQDNSSVYLPIKSSCLHIGKTESYSYSSNEFILNSNDVDFLNYLQEANKAQELGLLCIFKPGFVPDKYRSPVDYWSPFATAVGLYLINKNTNTVLANFSKYLDTTNPSKYIAILKQLDAKEKAASQRREQKEMREYQKIYGKNAYPCPRCVGLGSLTYWGNRGSYKKICGSCGGTGRIYKR